MYFSGRCQPTINNCMAEHAGAERGVCVLTPLWNFTKLSLTVNVKRLFVSYYKFRR